MKILRILILSLLALTDSFGQSISRDDYARAVSLMWDNLNNKKVFQLNVNPVWFSDSTGFWFESRSKEEKMYSKVTFKPLLKSSLFDHKQLAEKLNAALKKSFDPKALALENVKYVNNAKLEFNVEGKRFQFNPEANELKEIPLAADEANAIESKSPDGKWVAYTENYNLFVRSTGTGTVKQLSTGGKKNYEYASFYGWSDIMEGEGGERPKRFIARWSPDSKWIQTSICDLSNARKMYLLDWSVDTLYRARLLSYYRGSPGDLNIVYLLPVVFNVETGKETRIAMPPTSHEIGYSFEWSSKPALAYIDYLERGFQKGNILQIDFNTGKQTALVQDVSITNVDGFNNWLAEKAGKLIFTSERSGWKQLYALDLKTRLTRQLTSGSFFVNTFIYAEPKESGNIFFVASGKETGKNPYQQYLYSVTADGKTMKLLTPEDGNHEVNASPDRRYFVDNYSTPQVPTISVLREMKTGKIVMELSKGNIDGLTAMKWTAPQSFTAIGKDGKTTIYGLLWKPVNFDPSKKYPVIDNSYTGPHTQSVPRSFPRILGVNNQPLAELGFIVMMVDGLGTAGRSKEFHNASYKHMGKNLEDHVRAVHQLGKQYTWIDATRVGIFGHSAGGYDAGHAVLQYPDFYKVAVASSADHDFRMEKAWWPEMYMGWPVDSSYQEVSNITMAGNLKGKLLITHGGIDENVNPSATFKLAEMLVRADKQFDMLIFPSQRHGYQGAQQRYFTKKRWNYFVEHLGGQKPIWDFDWK